MAGQFRITWKGKKVEGELAALVEQRMRLAAAFVEGQVKRKISILNPSPHRSPSAPGEPPRVVTGHLRANITHQVIRSGPRVTGVVGATRAVPYARRLELGFSGTDAKGRNVDQAPRPYLVPTVIENRKKIGEILAGGGK